MARRKHSEERRTPRSLRGRGSRGRRPMATALLPVMVAGSLLSGCGNRHGPTPPAAAEAAAPPSTPPATTPPPPRASEGRILFDEPSPYGRVIVVDRAELRCLKFDLAGGDQSCLDRRQPQRLVHEYVPLLSVGLLFVRAAPRTLMVGLGGGRAVQMLLDHVPQLELDVVELNPVVVRAARQYFGIEPSARLRIHVADGRAFFRDRPERWDMVVLDAFGNDFIPFHLTTEQFLRTVAEHLVDGGAVLANLWTRNDRLFRAMVKTYARVFPRVYVFRAPRVGNAIVVATARPSPASCEEVQAAAAARADDFAFPFPLTDPPRRCAPASVLEFGDVPVLADEHRAEFDALGPL